jgi:hypothetical protein
MEKVAQIAKNINRDVCVFAEGARRRKMSDPNEINVNIPLKKGAFHILKEL